MSPGLDRAPAWAEMSGWTLSAIWMLSGLAASLVIESHRRRMPAGPLQTLGRWMMAMALTWPALHLLDSFLAGQNWGAAMWLASTVVLGASVLTSLVLPVLWRRAGAGPLATTPVEDFGDDHRNESTPAMIHGAALALATVETGVITLDSVGRITSMTAIAERIVGSTAQDSAGRSLDDVLVQAPPSTPLVSGDLQSSFEQAKWSAEAGHRLQLLDGAGSVMPVLLNASMLRDATGAIQGAVLVLRSLSAVMETQAEAARLAAIVDSSDDAIISKTLDGRITSWNRGASRLFGYEAAEMIGESIQTLIPDLRADEEMRIASSIAHGERVESFQTERLAKDGRIVHVSVTISPIRDSSGRIVGASKIARDVSAERLAQIASHSSGARLRFILDAAKIGDWDYDLQTGVVNRSLRHDRCYGYTEAAPGWSLDIFLKHVHPDDRQAAQAGFIAAIEAEQAWQSEYRVIWPDGSIHWLFAAGSVLRHQDGTRKMLGIVSDVSQAKQAEQARVIVERLEAENRQIQVASQLKSEFLANMSHELRTPLNAIIGFSDLLRSGAVPAGSAKGPVFLGHISSSGRHLLQLINDVLDLAKVESGKFEFFAEDIDLGELVDETRDVLQTLILKKSITLRTEIDDQLGQVRLDPSRLKQVLYNYLSNAIKFTAEGGTITVRAKPEGPLLFRLEVEDSGVGISEADQQRLFVEFQQLDSGYGKQQQGTGLGLALTRKLVEAQGGRVGVHSTLGVGSTFYLVINRRHGTVGAALKEAVAPVSAIALGPGQHRCLVIDDPRDGVARYLKALAETGFQIDMASDRQQLLTLARDQLYDAIALDLVMKSQPGLDLLSLLRSDNAHFSAPVVGLSIPVDPQRIASFAVANVLSKPIRIDELRAVAAQLRGMSPGRPVVLVIDDQPMALELMRGVLAGLDVDTLSCQSAVAALDLLNRARPDAIVLDLIMPGIDGFEVLDKLHRREDTRDIPVYIWTSMDLSAADYESLARSAERVLNGGGGGLEPVLGELRRRAARTAPTATLPRP
ncbi:hypothetical protein BH10PSE17_BH10PSE17_19940 [soil metagenome]